MVRELLIATMNTGKLAELRKLCEHLEIRVLGLADVPDVTRVDVEETASTLEGNALIKAYTYAVRTGYLTLAEDSGLEVDALKGAPGVRSARWVDGTDDDRNRALLKALHGVPESERSARFCTVIALVDPETLRAVTAEGEAEGRILFETRGTNGFGYDPLFCYSATGRTGGEMTRDEKNMVSHRSNALAHLPRLLAFLGQGSYPHH